MKKSGKFKCPCCEYYTINEVPPGTYEICPVCYWEDDDVQYIDPDFEGGANDMNLNEAKKNYVKMGAIDSKFMKHVRKPFKDEIR